MHAPKHLALAAAMLLLVAGCSAEQPEKAAEQPASTESAKPHLDARPSLLQVKKIVAAPVRFEYELLDTHGTRFYSLTGIAHPRAREWTGSIELDDPTTAAPADVRAKVKSIKESLWVQLDSGPYAGCWADVSSAVESTMGALAPLAGIPAVVLALTSLHRSNDRADVPTTPFGVSMPVRAAASTVLPPRIAEQIDGRDMSAGTVPTVVQVKGQDDVTIHVRGLDMADSLIGLGAAVPKQVETFLRSTLIQMRVWPSANPPIVLPPKKDTLVSAQGGGCTRAETGSDGAA